LILAFQNLEKKIYSSQPRNWWKEIKQICGTSKAANKDIQSILHSDLRFDDQTLSIKINESFVSVMADYDPLSDATQVLVDDDLPITVSVHSVITKLKQISASSAGGPDNIPNWVLKEYADILGPPVAEIINTSFRDCKVPNIWKVANIVPIPKAKTIEDFNKDLRPVSLTASLSTIAESFVIDEELKPTISKSIDPSQFGFIQKSSTTFALISMIDYWLKHTDGNGADIRSILLDYKKAFDLVDHHLLIAKRYSLGVKPTVINWLIDFLRDRMQRVKLNDKCYSEWLKVPAGIAQGTKVGPWFFLIMINDLNIECENFALWKFADDTTLSEIILKKQPSMLQEVLNSVNSWTLDTNFQLNPRKCKEMITSFKKSPIVYESV